MFIFLEQKIKTPIFTILKSKNETNYFLFHFTPLVFLFWKAIRKKANGGQ